MKSSEITILVIGGIILLIMFSCLCCCMSNASWRKRKIKEMEATSEIIQTAHGPIEISKKGKEPYILGLHGTPGAHDGVVGYWDPWIEQGFGIIAPSRHGYGRTPLENGRTPEEQADSFAALLDTLGIDKVIVMGGSGGGPVSIQFAARHPQRTAALLLECAVTGNFTHQKIDQMDTCATKFFATSATTFRLLGWMYQKFPASMINFMLQEASTMNEQERAEATMDLMNDMDRMKLMQKMLGMGESAMLYPSHEAMCLDVENFKAAVPFEKVEAPTLIAHGTKDGDIPFSQAEQAKNLIPNSELLTIEGGWHVLMFDPKGKEMFLT